MNVGGVGCRRRGNCAEVESAATALEEAIKHENKADIEAGIEALSRATAEFSQKAAANPESGGADGNKAGSSDTVDAEFEEVRDNKSGKKDH